MQGRTKSMKVNSGVGPVTRLFFGPLRPKEVVNRIWVTCSRESASNIGMKLSVASFSSLPPDTDAAFASQALQYHTSSKAFGSTDTVGTPGSPCCTFPVHGLFPVELGFIVDQGVWLGVQCEAGTDLLEICVTVDSDGHELI